MQKLNVFLKVRVLSCLLNQYIEDRHSLEVNHLSSILLTHRWRRLLKQVLQNNTIFRIKSVAYTDQVLILQGHISSMLIMYYVTIVQILSRNTNFPLDSVLTCANRTWLQSKFHANNYRKLLYKGNTSEVDIKPLQSSHTSQWVISDPGGALECVTCGPYFNIILSSQRVPLFSTQFLCSSPCCWLNIHVID